MTSQQRAYLEELRQLIQAGYLYQRNDHMSELRIEGFTQVQLLITKLLPYLRFKRKQAKLLLAALKILTKQHYTLDEFLLITDIADQISEENYTSKLRKYTSTYVRTVLRVHGLVPVTTESLSKKPETAQ